MGVLQTLAAELDDLLAKANAVKSAVDEANAAPSSEQAIVDAVVAALEAQGYTVTPPSPPVTQIPVTDGTEAPADAPVDQPAA